MKPRGLIRRPRKRARESVRIALYLLGEFSFGYKRLRGLRPKGAAGINSTPRRFYMDALYFLTAGFYIGGSRPLLGFLRDVDLDADAEKIEEILARRMGSTTVRDILADFRNKHLSHPTFTSKPLAEYIHSKFDLKKRENLVVFMESLTELWNATNALVAKVKRIHKAMSPTRYPAPVLR